MSITITEKKPSRFSGEWVLGKTESGCEFAAKVFDRPLRQGFPTPRFEEGGNVTQLEITRNKRIVFQYFGFLQGEVMDEVYDIVQTLERQFCKREKCVA